MKLTVSEWGVVNRVLAVILVVAIGVVVISLAGCGARIPVWNDDYIEMALGYQIEGTDSQLTAASVTGIVFGGLYMGVTNYTTGRATGAENVSRSVTEHLDAQGQIVSVTETVTLGDLSTEAEAPAVRTFIDRGGNVRVRD